MPHIWVDEAHTLSVVDFATTDYVLLGGCAVDAAPWQAAVAELNKDFPINFRQLLKSDERGIFADDGLVLLRPDAVIADHWQAETLSPEAAGKKLRARLPLGH